MNKLEYKLTLATKLFSSLLPFDKNRTNSNWWFIVVALFIIVVVAGVVQTLWQSNSKVISLDSSKFHSSFYQQASYLKKLLSHLSPLSFFPLPPLPRLPLPLPHVPLLFTASCSLCLSHILLFLVKIILWLLDYGSWKNSTLGSSSLSHIYPVGRMFTLSDESLLRNCNPFRNFHPEYNGLDLTLATMFKAFFNIFL